MRKVYRYVPDISQTHADRATEVVERLLSAYGVSRAQELPEEGQVRLMRELQGFYRRELPGGLQLLSPNDLGWRGAIKRTWLTLTGRRHLIPRP